MRRKDPLAANPRRPSALPARGGRTRARPQEHRAPALTRWGAEGGHDVPKRGSTARTLRHGAEYVWARQRRGTSAGPRRVLDALMTGGQEVGSSNLPVPTEGQVAGVSRVSGGGSYNQMYNHRRSSERFSRMSHGSRKRVWLHRLAAAMLAVAVASCQGPSEGSFLQGPLGTRVGGEVPLGRPLSLGVPLAKPSTSDAVHLLSVRPVEVDKNIEVISVRVVRPSELGGTLMSFPGDPREVFRDRFRPHPFASVVLVPDQVPDWEIILTLRSNVPGTHLIGGMEIKAQVGGRVLLQTLHTELKIVAVDCETTAAAAKAVCSGKLPTLPPRPRLRTVSPSPTST
jgi:hypothetical protein